MIFKKILAILLTILPLTFFAACSRNNPETTEMFPGLDVQVRESPEPTELNPDDLLTWPWSSAVFTRM